MNKRGKLVYPGHRLRPEDFLTFIELTPFTRMWRALGLTDDDLLLVQLGIMCAPKGSPIIRGCAGVRKLRFSPSGTNVGKSGSMRCLYKFYEELHTVVFALVYPKGTKETISDQDKKIIRKAIEDIEEEWSKEK